MVALVVSPQATNYAGINQFGLYYQPREVITLADEHMWDAEPFDDEEVEGMAEDFRDFLHDIYAESYLDITDHIAAYLNRDAVELAEKNDGLLTGVRRLSQKESLRAIPLVLGEHPSRPKVGPNVPNPR